MTHSEALARALAELVAVNGNVYLIPVAERIAAAHGVGVVELLHAYSAHWQAVREAAVLTPIVKGA